MGPVNVLNDYDTMANIKSETNTEYGVLRNRTNTKISTEETVNVLNDYDTMANIKAETNNTNNCS